MQPQAAAHDGKAQQRTLRAPPGHPRARRILRARQGRGLHGARCPAPLPPMLPPCDVSGCVSVTSASQRQSTTNWKAQGSASWSRCSLRASRGPGTTQKRHIRANARDACATRARRVGSVRVRVRGCRGAGGARGGAGRGWIAFARGACAPQGRVERERFGGAPRLPCAALGCRGAVRSAVPAPCPARTAPCPARTAP